MSIHIHVDNGEPISITVDGIWVELRPKERVVTAALALRHPDIVTLDQLINMVWPNSAPATAKQSIHNHLARLRTAVPELIRSDSVGYGFGTDVALLVNASEDDPRLPTEFADTVELRRARIEFARRHSTRQHADLTQRVRTGITEALVAEIEAEIHHDVCDERAWWLLAICAVHRQDVAAGTEVVAKARDALSSVGLEPGRRLVDLDGMLRDGVDNVDVLLRDHHGARRSADLQRLDDAVAPVVAEVRSAWAEHERFLVRVRGDDGAARRAALAKIVDDARASGFSTAFSRHRRGALGTPTAHIALLGTRPLVAVVDGVDASTDPVGLLTDLAASLPEPPVGWIIAEGHGTDLEGVGPAIGRADDAVFAVDTPHVDVEEPDMTVLATSTIQLLVALAELGEPALPEDLEPAIPGASAAALDLARSGLVRVDAATKTIDLISTQVADAALSVFDADQAEAFALLLVSLELPRLDPARRHTLRSRWSIAARGASDERTLEHTRFAVDEYSRQGKFAVAAATAQRVLELIEVSSGRTTEWCQLAILAGQALLAGGDPSGDTLLSEVVTAAREIDDHEVAALATHEWCRLGTAGGAGTVDDERLDVTNELLDELSDPGQRAKVGAAAAMVLSLAADPDLLRTRFTDAVADAHRDGRPEVMADVLPLAYMSVPLHTDLDARETHAARLLDIGERLDRPDSRWEALQLRYSSQIMRGDPGFRATLTDLTDVAGELHERSRDWEMCFIRSNVALINGDLARARSEIDDSLRYAGMVDAGRVGAVFGAHHLVASLIEGTTGGLLESLRSLAHDQPGIGAWQAALAVSAAAAGQHDEAVHALSHLLNGDEPIGLLHDPVYTAGLIAFGEAAAMTRDERALQVAEQMLEPLAGMWSWCGSCTFGPVDLTRSRVALALDQPRDAEAIASAAVMSCADMRAPLFTRQATDVLLAAATR
ncbi:MAG: hypothetical protein AB8G14_18630 [Ilumatobacter sp.]